MPASIDFLPRFPCIRGWPCGTLLNQWDLNLISLGNLRMFFAFLMQAPTLSSAWNSDVMTGLQQPYHDKEVTTMEKRQRWSQSCESRFWPATKLIQVVIYTHISHYMKKDEPYFIKPIGWVCIICNKLWKKIVITWEDSQRWRQLQQERRQEVRECYKRDCAGRAIC